ncbi:MAG: hypothetical protein HKN03_17560 [Acidimicrobiales bacterium]|nr:hypothetical protein [Acidimicrobiales bacterium]
MSFPTDQTVPERTSSPPESPPRAGPPAPPSPPFPPDPPIGYVAQKPGPEPTGYTFPRLDIPKFDAARWVAGLGVILLLAAGAAVLSAQWQTLNEAGRLGILVAATVALAVVAQRVFTRAPATANAAFVGAGVMGAFDVGGAVVVGGGGWPEAITAVGLSGLAIAELLRRSRPGVIPNALFVLAGVSLAAGVAVVSGIPVQLALGVMAILSWFMIDRRWVSAAWAAITALAPLVLAIEGTDLMGQGTLERMGLLGAEHGWAAAVGGSLAAVAFGLLTASERDARYSIAGLASVVLGAVTAWSFYQPPALYGLYFGAALFLLVEITAMLLPRSAGYQQMLTNVRIGIEAVGGSIITLTVLLQLLEPTFSFGEFGMINRPLAATAVITGLAWLVAAFNHQRIEPLVLVDVMALAAMLFAVIDGTIIGLSQVAVGLAVAFLSERSSLAAFVGGLSVAVLGGWVTLVDLTVAFPEPFVWPVAVAWLLVAERFNASPALRWLIPAALVSFVHIAGHISGDSTAHLTTLAAAGVLMAATGGWRAERSPLLTGAVIATSVGLYQVTDVTVGVAGWGWLAVGGSALIALAALLEYTSRWDTAPADGVPVQASTRRRGSS